MRKDIEVVRNRNDSKSRPRDSDEVAGSRPVFHWHLRKWLSCVGGFLALLVMDARPVLAAQPHKFVIRQTIKEIRFAAGIDRYFVSFEGAAGRNKDNCIMPVVNEQTGAVDDGMVVSASAVGVATTTEDVDRMMAQLNIAFSLGKQVDVWVLDCDHFGNGNYNYPKAYNVIIFQ